MRRQVAGCTVIDVGTAENERETAAGESKYRHKKKRRGNQDDMKFFSKDHAIAVLKQLLFFGSYVFAVYCVSDIFALTGQPKKDENSSFLMILGFLCCVASVIVMLLPEPKTYPFVVPIVASLTVNALAEASRGQHSIKSNFADTFLLHLFLVTIFSPAYFDLFASKLYLVVAIIICEVLGVSNFYSRVFRQAPLRPNDFLNLNSILELKNKSTYSLDIPKGKLLGVLMVCNFLCICRFAFSKKKFSYSKKAIFLLLAAICFPSLLFTKGLDIVVDGHIQRGSLHFFNVGHTYSRLGCLYGFYIDFAYISKEKKLPGYSVMDAETILSGFETNTEPSSHLRRPNIVAILSESLADFTIHDELHYAKGSDFMPFMRNLNNSVHGFVSVSCYGTLTCNSEYEFLSGNSMNFYPYGTAAYVEKYNDHQELITYILNDYGYNCVAAAPVSRALWNIGKVYPTFEFKESFYQGQFYGGPDKYKWIVQDKPLFEGFLELYKQRRGKGPQFFFLTTMQNHGPYEETNSSIYSLVNHSHPLANTYLNRVRITDDVVKGMIEYFSSVDEDVVVVLFGDHYPDVTPFWVDLFGCEFDELSLKAKSKMYMTPYFIWANYPIKSGEENISLSFLSTKVMEVAGIPLTPYKNFLNYIKEHVPIITPVSYMDSKGNWHWRDEVTDATPYIDQYRMVQEFMVNDYQRKEHRIQYNE